MVSQIARQKGVKSLFNSSQIPGEILDLTVVRTDVLNRPDGSGRSSPRPSPAPGTKSWRRCRPPARRQGAGRDRRGSQDTLASYKEQLSTTHMFYTPQVGRRSSARRRT